MESTNLFAQVSRALGHVGVPQAPPPPPPAIDEPITRLVHADIGLPQLFAKRAGEMKMGVTFSDADEVAASVAGFLHDHKCQRIALPASEVLNRLWIPETLPREGFDVRRWDDPEM